MTPTLSATMVARNEERFVGEALAGIASQTRLPDELVIVDDASADRTVEIVEAFQAPFPVRCVRHTEPLGSIAARNRAVREARGEFIAECDADDVWLPEKLERQLGRILDEGAGRVALVGCAARNVTENGADAGAFSVGLTTPEASRAALEGAELLVMPHSSVLFRREDFERVGGYREDYLGAEDVELWERMAACGLVLNVGVELLLYRKKRGGLMQTVFWRQQVNDLRILENRRRTRAGQEPLSYEAFERRLREQPRSVRWRRRRRWYGKYLYRFGAANLVNGRRAVGSAQLALGAALDPARVRSGVARYAKRSQRPRGGLTPARVVSAVRRRADKLVHPPVDAEVPASVLARYVRHDPVIVEAGAHRGFDTLKLSAQWPRGVIHAFEPVPHIHADMARRVASCANVRPYRDALAGETGTAEMWVSSGGGDLSSSLRAPKDHLVDLPEVVFEEQVSVPTVTLDDWAVRESVERVDLFWLDLQGMELDALKGATRLLERATAVYSEVLGTEQYEGAALYDELRDWLAGHGFTPEIEKRPWNGSGNVLFLRRGGDVSG